MQFPELLHDFRLRTAVRTAGPLHTAAYAHQGRGDHRAAPRAHPPPAAAKTRVSGITPRNATHMHSARPGARAGRPVGSCGRARNAHASHAPARASALTPAGCRGITAPPRPRRASLCLSVSLSLSLSLSLSPGRTRYHASLAVPRAAPRSKPNTLPIRNRALASASGDALPLAGLIACALCGRHVASRP